MENESVIKASALYNGHSIKKNFDVELKLRFIDTQLANSLQFIAGIGQQVQLRAIINEEKLYLGLFNINSIRVDRDGNSFISFMSNSESVSLESIEKHLVEDTDIRIAGKIVKNMNN